MFQERRKMFTGIIKGLPCKKHPDFRDIKCEKNVSLRIDEIQYIWKVRVGDVSRLSGGNYWADRKMKIHQEGEWDNNGARSWQRQEGPAQGHRGKIYPHELDGGPS